MGHYYQKDGKEGVQKALARAANCFSFGDNELAQFIYDAASKHWFFFSSPILSNAVEGYWGRNYWDSPGIDAWVGEKPKAMPIACFLTYAPDNIKGQTETAQELALLSVNGGGTAVHSAIRAVSEKAPGPIPYFKTIDATMGYYKQGKTRKGATALYIDISHPDIVEFINMRKPTGGDPSRKIDNRTAVHCGVNITHAFEEARDHGKGWDLVCPHTGEVRETVDARQLWESLLEAREFTGEPYLYFIDVANKSFPEAQKKKGLKNNGSNLCTEITLATSEERTAVCCLSSVNLEKYDEWKDSGLIEKLITFLDNVIEWFLLFGDEDLHKAKFSASQERAIGIGAMGWANYLMSKQIPFESGGLGSAAQMNYIIFKQMYEEGVAASLKLGSLRGEAPDMVGTGRRNSHLFAIAPNANSSVLCNTSPSIEPLMSNAYAQKSRTGISLVKNKYLEKWLMSSHPEVDQEAFWREVVKNNGSVQWVPFMDEHTKRVFKTAWEIDQHWVVEHAGNRQPFICQAQSLNVFFLPKTDRAYINSVHLKASRERKVKSLYYFRTGSEGSPDTVKQVVRVALKDSPEEESVCLSCEG